MPQYCFQFFRCCPCLLYTSSVLAAMLAKAIGKQLTCVFVDHGLLRKNEKLSLIHI